MAMADLQRLMLPGLSRLRAVEARVAAAAATTIVAVPSEPPVRVWPSSLVRDLRRLLAFPDEKGEGDESGGDWRCADVTLRAGGGGGSIGSGGGGGGHVYAVGAHRSVLSLRCPHFRAMLTSGAWVGERELSVPPPEHTHTHITHHTYTHTHHTYTHITRTHITHTKHTHPPTHPPTHTHTKHTQACARPRTRRSTWRT